MSNFSSRSNYYLTIMSFPPCSVHIKSVLSPCFAHIWFKHEKYTNNLNINNIHYFQFLRQMYCLSINKNVVNIISRTFEN